MTKLYIANPTRQDRLLHYRIAFRVPGQIGGDRPMYKQQNIPRGKQILIMGADIEMAAAEEIVRQLNVYGMQGVTDLRGGQRPRGFVPLVFNIDRDVPKPLIAEMIVHNDGVKKFEGVERRRLAAVAANESLLKNLDAEMPTPAELVVDVEQDDQTEAGEDRIEEGVRVVNKGTVDGPKPPAAGKGRGKGAGTGRGRGGRKAA